MELSAQYTYIIHRETKDDEKNKKQNYHATSSSCRRLPIRNINTTITRWHGRCIKILSLCYRNNDNIMYCTVYIIYYHDRRKDNNKGGGLKNYNDDDDNDNDPELNNSTT